MSDRERNALKRAIEELTPPSALGYGHPASVQRQDLVGNVDVDLDTGGPMPGASGVVVAYGLPSTRCKLRKDTRARVCFDNGDARRRVFNSFDAGTPCDEINIANATESQGAARVGDTVFCGTLSWEPTPPAGMVPTGGVLTYQSNGSGPNEVTLIQWAIVGPIAITQIFPPSSTPSIGLRGVINSGSLVVKIGG